MCAKTCVEDITPIADINPVDGVYCETCKRFFVVEEAETDGTYVIGWNIFCYEFVPRFCPHCGSKLF